MNQVEADGERLAAISNAIVGIFRESYGRGPTKAKTYAFDDYVLCVLEDILTTVERTLVESGEEKLVRDVRLRFQETEAKQFTDAVEELDGPAGHRLPQPDHVPPGCGFRDVRARRLSGSAVSAWRPRKIRPRSSGDPLSRDYPVGRTQNCRQTGTSGVRARHAAATTKCSPGAKRSGLPSPSAE